MRMFKIPEVYLLEQMYKGATVRMAQTMRKVRQSHQGIFACGGVVFKNHHSDFINCQPLENELIFQNTHF